MYRAANGITSKVISAAEARAAWDSTPAHLRGGDPDSGFIIWPESATGGRIACAGTAYIPLGEDPCTDSAPP